MGINYRERWVIYNLYKHERRVVSFSNRYKACIGKGVRSDCYLSQYVYNQFMCYKAIDKVREEVQVSINVHGEKIDMLRFADNIVIMTEKPQELQEVLTTIDRIMEEYFNMEISRIKTKSWFSVETDLVE